ncbi:unnamed protein product [Trifolium pratense]|uniref:Uncharacterized protein n=1 Tax=Trifolium pratense TaxID=57577 RepID=A0ACB0J5X6_TRIPR|nr:unnamed protein product [Trifolium pratense]
MAEPNMQMSLSGSSSDSDQETPYTTTTPQPPTTMVGGSSYQQTPPSANSPNRQPISPPYKKPRGRPPGSKNKPKPPLVITQDNEQAMKPVVIEVAAGTDVLEAVIQFAVRSASCLTVLSGSGTIAVATLHYPLCRSPAFTLHGPFSLMSLTGTFLYPPPPPPPPPPVSLSLPIGPSGNPNPVELMPGGLSFGITLAGLQGQVFGGIIGGKVIAGGDGVKITVSLFKNPEFHRAGGVILGADDDDEEDDAGGGDDNNGNGNGGNNGGGDQGASGSGGVGGSDQNVSSFGAHNPMPLNLAHSDQNFVPWNHP